MKLVRERETTGRVTVVVSVGIAEAVRRLRERAERAKADLDLDAEIGRLLARLIKQANRELDGVYGGATVAAAAETEERG